MPKRDLAFVEYIQVWKQRAGTAYGQMSDPTAPTGTSHALLLDDPVAINFGQIQREKASFRGGGQFFGQMTGAISQIPDFTFTQAHLDAAFRALANQSHVDTTTISGLEISGANENNFALEKMGISFHVRAQNRDEGTDGDEEWWNLIIPQCEIIVEVPASLGIRGSDNSSPARVTVRPSFGGKFPIGLAFGANQGFKNNRAMAVEIVCAHPLALTTNVRDGTATSYNLLYLPIFSSVTGGNTKNGVTKNGAFTAPTSISTSDGEVTNAAVGTEGDLDECWYQTDFVAA